ncbi:PREDICTED: uncharacterized protein LOC104808467 [Tarenaya hassleriana]|uniref:uncharacterized protein LOC104808467 n=1 Tax=Tarenaya hassleriana TaxID=28532 RepID=UPI00053C9220|nr:PREDICTED: uncharacterized protein LOC104808467 [Tarenaya hassleriana]
MSPPMFDGENYQVWSVKMKVFLKGSDLWEAVEEDYEIPPLTGNPTLNQIRSHKEKVTRKAKAMSCIFSAVSPSVFTKIMNLESAKAMWDLLQKEFEGDDKIRGMKVLNLMRDFERQQMKPSESIKEYVDRLVEIVNKIRILGTDITDQRIVQKIMVSVPERFEATLASLENTKEMANLKLAELLSSLQAQEQRRIMRKEESTEGALKAKAKFSGADKGKKSGWKHKVEGSSQHSGQESGENRGYPDPCKHCNKKGHPHWRCWKNLKCRRCDKLGHIEKFCKSKMAQQTEVVNADAKEVEQMFVASCFVSKSEDDNWLIDSGCTNHMTEILKKFKFDGCKSVRTPMNMKEKLVLDETEEEVDERNYRSLVGCLMYLTASRPDVLFAVNVLSSRILKPIWLGLLIVIGLVQLKT